MPRFRLLRFARHRAFIAVLYTEEVYMQPSRTLVAGAIPRERQLYFEMRELICGSPSNPGMIHTLNRTVQSLDKLEKTVSDFVTSTVTALSGQSARLDRLVDAVTRHEAQLESSARQRSGMTGYVVRILFERIVPGVIQAFLFLGGAAAFVYYSHIHVPLGR